MNSRRDRLADIAATDTTNAGLWLDKYIVSQDRESKESRSTLVSEVAAIATPNEAYANFFERWERALVGVGAHTRKAKVLGRAVVGLGGEGVLEVSIALHRTYGLPFIPGSALKGLASSYARNYLGECWQSGSDAHRVVFGDASTAGYLNFFDALYVPNADSKAVHADVLTVHHQDYYGDPPSAAPADWDDPNPVPFLSVTGEYLVALGAVTGCEEWINRTFEILKYALKEEGVGAKTSSGYGRLELAPPPTDRERQMADSLIHDISVFPVGKVAAEITKLVDKWRGLQVGPTQKKRVAQALIEKNRQADREKAVKDKPWYRELIDCLTQS